MVGDSLVELDESFSLELSNLDAAGRQVALGSDKTYQITNDDSAEVLIGDVQMPEGDVGATPFEFLLELDNPVAAPFSVVVFTTDDTANEFEDYQGISTGVDFNGVASEVKTVTVLVEGDDVPEDDESFLLVGSSVQSGQYDVDFAVPAFGIGVILDDDGFIFRSGFENNNL